MRLLSFLVWKSWASSPLRFALTLLGVALGVAVVVSIHVLDHNTILSQLARVRWDYGRVDYELRPLEAGADLVAHREALARNPEIARVGLLGQTPAHARAATGGESLLVSVYGQFPAGGELFAHYRVAAGADLDEVDADDEVLVAGSLAERLGLAIGDRFDLTPLAAALTRRCVEGELVEAEGAPDDRATVSGPVRVRIKGVLEPFRLARRDGGLVVVCRYPLARKLARAFQPLLQVKRAEGVDPDRLAMLLRRDYVLDDARTALIGEGADERAFRNGVKVLGCLALVLGMFVIFHTLSYAITEKIRRVGILRALGATPGQVSLVFIADALVLSIAGTAAGVALGVLIARLLAAANITTLGLGKTVAITEIPWPTMIAVAILAIVITMLGAAFPLMKVRTLSPQRILYVRDLAPPADLMRGVNVFLMLLLVIALPIAYLAMTPLLSGDGSGAGIVMLEVIGILAVFFGVLLLSPRLVRAVGSLPLALVRAYAPLSSFLVEKNLLRAPARVASAVCGLTLVALAMIGLRALTGSLKGEVRAFGALALEDRLFVRASEPVAEATWKRLAAVPGVVAVLPLSAIVAMPFRCCGTDARELAKPGGPLHERPDLLARMIDGRGLVVSSRLAKLRRLAPGDTVAAATGSGVVRYDVIAIDDRDGFFPDERAVAVAHRAWFKHDFCLDVSPATRWSLRLDAGAEAPVVAAAAREILGPVAAIYDGRDVLQRHLDDVDRDFLYFDILLWLMLALAGVGQVNLITLATIARTREIGVLRALGVTRGGFLQMLIVEALVIGFLAGLLAFVAGIPLSLLLVRGLVAVSGLEVPYVVPWEAAFGVALVSFAVAILAALPPAFRATRVAPAVAVRGSE